MPDERKSSKTPDEWITLAQQGKEVWNEQVALLQPNDFIDFRKAEIFNSNFIGFHFPMTTDFTGATFQSDVSFSSAEFRGIACFQDATFNGEAYFIHATFTVRAYFTRAKFNDNAFFGEAVFSKLTFFRNATFKLVGEFGSTRFQNAVNFKGVKFDSDAKFQGAVFYMPPIFKAEDLHGDVSFNHVTRFGKQFTDVKSPHAETAYRELKLGMKRIEAHTKEDAFFRLEMLTRKHREPWARKWLYWLYEFASDYGQSIARPLGWLVVFFGIFFGLYWGFPQLLGDKNMPDDHISNALHLAMQKAFVFPGMFSEELSKGITLSGWGTLLAGVHWLLSAASWFLMLLGLRNRFRLK